MFALPKKTAVAALALVLALPASPCTTFVSDGPEGPLFARNYDFEFGEALVVVNPRGLARVSATADLSSPAPARWTSRFGSVTFNQFGVGFPTGGINERGLVVELMWLDGTKYPAADARPTVTTLEFIQYLLDRSATLDEAMEAARAVRIAGRTPLHFLVSDAAGRTATVEFLDGQLVVHRDAALPVRALANDRYDRSLAALQSSRPDAGDRSSLARFVRAADRAPSVKSAAQAFEVLDSVAQPGATHWQIVYQMAPRTIQWRTSANGAMRTLRLDALSFDCRDGVRLVNADAGRGDMRGAFAAYTRAADEAQLHTAYRKVSFFRGDAAKQAAEDAARTEQRMRCL
jgi:penicillin V acylase-like amidase (Ntn superfamily)